MRVAVFHELPLGGAHDATNKFSYELSKHSIDVDLYYVSEEKDNSDLSFYKYIYFYKITPKIWTGKNWKNRFYNDTIFLYQLIRLHKKIATKINSKKYDLVLIHGSKYIESPFILQYINSIKVFYCHDPNYRIAYEKTLKINHRKVNSIKYMYEIINRKIRKYLDKNNFNKINYVIANSNYAKKIIFKTYKKKSVVIYPGVNVSFFTPLISKRKDIDVFYIGSKAKIDGYELLKKASKILSNKLTIYTKMYEDGWISADKIRDLYRRSKIVVCLAHNEPFGSVPIEAFSAGVPVIAVNEGGHMETVKNGKNGILIPRNYKNLAQKINYLLKNDKIRVNMGKQARKIAINSWSWEYTGKMLADYLKNLNEVNK